MLPPIRTLPGTRAVDTPIETPLGGRELDAVRAHGDTVEFRGEPAILGILVEADPDGG